MEAKKGANINLLHCHTCYKMPAAVQNKFDVSYTYYKMYATINKCLVSYLEMSYTYLIAGIET